MSTPAAEDWISRDFQRLDREGRIAYPPTAAEWDRVWQAASKAVETNPTLTNIEPFIVREAPALLRAARVLPTAAAIPRGALVCTRCHHIGKPVMHTKGSLAIECVLWLFLLVPGLIYSIWRHTSRGNVCAKCACEDLIPSNSPRAVAMLR